MMQGIQECTSRKDMILSVTSLSLEIEILMQPKIVLFLKKQMTPPVQI